MKEKIIKQFVLAVIIVLFATPIHSQRIYFNLGAGYGVSAAPSIYFGTDNSSSYTLTYDGTSTTDTYIDSYKNIKGTGSFGKGFQTGAIIGYMITKHIGAELGINYLMGTSITSKNVHTEKYIDLTNMNNNSSTSTSEEATTFGTMLRFTPAIRITTVAGKIKPYMRIGLVIGAGSKLHETYKSTHTAYGLTDTYALESEVSGGASLGFACGLGADFKLHDNVGFFVEMGFIAQSWAPKQGLITRSTLNGINKLPTMTTNDKETIFVDNYSVSSASSLQNINESSPRKELKVFFPFSSVGINLGVRISLGKKK
jgi:hypothetical protein